MCCSWVRCVSTPRRRYTLRVSTEAIVRQGHAIYSQERIMCGVSVLSVTIRMFTTIIYINFPIFMQSACHGAPRHWNMTSRETAKAKMNSHFSLSEHTTVVRMLGCRSQFASTTLSLRGSQDGRVGEYDHHVMSDFFQTISMQPVPTSIAHTIRDSVLPDDIHEAQCMFLQHFDVWLQ